MYVAASIIYDAKFLSAQEAKEKYEAEYDRPFTHRGANGYDLMRFLGGLLENEEISGQSVKRLLENGCTYAGVFGTIEVELEQHDIGLPLHPT